MLRAYSAILAASALLALAPPGCGSDDEPEPETRTETAQPVPELPKDWKVDRNDAGGFALGVPPGWRAEAEGAVTRLHSPDQLVVMSVTPDRSDEVLEDDLAALTKGTAAAYGEQFKGFKAGKARRYDHQYDAHAVEAKGQNKGVDQALEVILLRREGLVTFTVFLQRNEGFGSGSYQPTIDRIVRSIRSRPVG